MQVHTLHSSKHIVWKGRESMTTTLGLCVGIDRPIIEEVGRPGVRFLYLLLSSSTRVKISTVIISSVETVEYT